MNNQTIFRKQIILLAFRRQNYYHGIKYIIFKSYSSKYNEVSHYHLYLIKRFSVYWNSSFDQRSICGWSYINKIYNIIALWRGKKYFIPRREFIFPHVWNRGSLALDPSQNKFQLRFLLRAHGGLADNVGVNLGLNWPPLARGFQISRYTPTHQATTSSYP